VCSLKSVPVFSVNSICLRFPVHPGSKGLMFKYERSQVNGRVIDMV